ncbi:ABC transporter ATP-binding protein/permease wht-3 [Armadillidium vulgare]|nr:ABC transporter ATP-binding protein/permease wht-3 [Armadillidium vulgare]
MLRMDKHLTYEERMIRVDEVITELGLTKCSDTKIGIPGRIKGISGGETKRLAFACEGKTILSTIHQPSSEVYAMFDRVLLMAEGRVAFLGDVDAAYDFFSRISLYSKKDFKLKLKNHCTKHLGGSNFGPSYGDLGLKFRENRMIIRVRFFQVVAIAILLGIIYFHQRLDQAGVTNINGALFLLLSNMTFQNVFGVINVILSHVAPKFKHGPNYCISFRHSNDALRGFLNKGSVPVYLSWVRYLSWFSYGNEALNINQWENIDSIACTRNETCFPNGSSILAYYNYDEGSIALNILFLILLLLFYRTLAFLALLSKTFRKRN